MTKTDKIRLHINVFTDTIKSINSNESFRVKNVYICDRLIIAKAYDTLIYFTKNKPSKRKHTEFYNNRFYNKNSLLNKPWWDAGENIYSVEKIHANNQRILFLEYLIGGLNKELKKKSKRMNKLIIKQYKCAIDKITEDSKIGWHSFICHLITDDSYEYFVKNRPTLNRHKKFFAHPLFNKDAEDCTDPWWIVDIDLYKKYGGKRGFCSM